MTLQCFINYLCTDFRRLGKSYRWAAGTIGVVVMLFFSLEGDLVLKGFGTGNVLSTYFNSTNMTGFLIAFSFCAFPFATVYPEEREHKYICYSVIRGNLKSYVLSKTTVIYISSLATMILGSLLFLLLCRIQVPWMDWGGDRSVRGRTKWLLWKRSEKRTCDLVLHAVCIEPWTYSRCFVKYGCFVFSDSIKYCADAYISSIGISDFGICKYR